MAEGRRKGRRAATNGQSTSATSRSNDSDAQTMTDLKQFVKEMAKGRGRAVEMRLAILLSVGLSLRVLLFSDAAAILQSSAARSVFFFMLIAIVIIVMSTWLDYFPVRLETVKMRTAGGQGLPLACLLPAMSCIAVLCNVTVYKPELIELVSLYLVLCCAVSLATQLPTLFHAAPYPNSIVVYNLALLIIVFIISNVLETPLFPLLFHSILYSLLVPFLIQSFPESFTLCEASLLSQSISLLVTDSTLLLCHKMEWYQLPSSLAVERSNSILFLEFGVTGFVVCCLLFVYFLYKLASTDDSFYRHLWSLAFLQLSFLFAFFVLLPILKMIMRASPIIWLMRFLLSTQERVYLLLYWISIVCITSAIVWAQSSQARVLACLRSENPSSLWMRKWFHLLALAVYIPGLVLDPNLLSIAASLVTVAFLVIELIRLFRVWPFGDIVHRLLIPFTDSRDSGDLILTHTYLLLGFSLPIWLYPLTAVTSVSKLSMYAGVLSLGVGDSIAAVSGTLVGRHKWPGTSKTFEGTLMSIICQLIVLAGIVTIDTSIPQLSQYTWSILVASIVLGAAMEAYTHQIDNLILGVFQFIVCIAFL